MPAANPLIYELNADEWTPVALGILSGAIKILNVDVLYYETYRLAGESAPDNGIAPDHADFEGIAVYNRRDRVAGHNVYVGGVMVASVDPVDVYVYPRGGAGKVRVDRGA